MDVIAELRLLVLYPDGAAVPVNMRVGRPVARTEGDWVCPVEAEGLRMWQGPDEIYGIGAWHALMMGQRFLREILTSEVRQGAVLHGEDGQESVSVEELFVQHEIK